MPVAAQGSLRQKLSLRRPASQARSRTASIRLAIWAECLVGPANGTATLIEEVVRRLLAHPSQQFTATIICPSWGNPAEIASRFGFSQDRLRVIVVKGQLWPLRFAWLAGLCSLTKSVGPHDLWLSGHPWPLGARDTPFVGIVHDLRMLEGRNATGLGLWRDMLWRALTWASVSACMRRAAVVTAVSDATRSRLLSFMGSSASRVKVIPNGVDAAYWSARSSPHSLQMARMKCGIGPNDDFVLALGSHTPHKNFPRLIDAFLGVAEADPASHLVIAGNNKAAGAREVALAVAKSPARSRIRVIGPVSSEELRALVQASRVFASPSLYEGFGIPVLEAMAAGTPVVASSIAAHREVSGNAAVLVDPLDVVAWSNALARVWFDDHDRQQRVKDGLRWVKRYDWAAIAEEYRRLFVSAAGPGKQQ